MIRRLFQYLEKVYRFTDQALKLKDSRKHPQVSTSNCFRFAFWLLALGERSLNGFEERLKQEERRSLWDKIFCGWPPSADSVGYSFERLDLEGLREFLHHIYTTLQRNHRISKLSLKGWRILALDGHELFSSYVKHGDQCCERTVHTKKGERIQYYYKVATAQLVGAEIALPLDVEPILPGEGEITAGMRLLERMLRNYPKAFDIVAADALYANPGFLELLQRHGKHLVATLKDNHPDLLEDAQALFQRQPPSVSEEGKTQMERWDLEGFNTWSQVGQEMRVVRSRETRTGKDKIVVADWFWVTEAEKALLPTELICLIGHARWDIENQGFNYMTHYFCLNHIFRHHPKAILAFILVEFLSYILLQAFYWLNLKQQRRAKLCLLGLMKELSSSFWTQLKEVRTGMGKRPP